MSDSILIAILLNEDNRYKNTWTIYTLLFILSVIYLIFYDVVKAVLYACITLEISLRILHYFVEHAAANQN